MGIVVLSSAESALFMPIDPAETALMGPSIVISITLTVCWQLWVAALWILPRHGRPAVVRLRIPECACVGPFVPHPMVVRRATLVRAKYPIAHFPRCRSEGRSIRHHRRPGLWVRITQLGAA